MKFTFAMNIKEIEQRIVELKAAQGDHFRKKKAERNPDQLVVVREELNRLKKQAGAMYRGRPIPEDAQ